MRPEHEAGVDFCNGVNGVRPEEGLCKGLDEWFVFSERKLVVRIGEVACDNLLSGDDVVFLELSTHSISELNLSTEMDFLCKIVYIYLGSQWTYPLLAPLTSLTMISSEPNSKAVTASNATSKRTRAHSKNA